MLNGLKQTFSFFKRLIPHEVKFWRSQWGNDIWLSHGSEHSAGVGTLKCNFTGNILYSDIDINGNFVCQVIDFNRIILIVTNVYGYNSKAENEILFDNIEQKLLIWLDKFPNAFLLVGGDFNVALNVLDRWPSRQNSHVNCYLKLFMQRFDLIDIWREKFPTDRMYTWSNKTGSSQSRIDYWLMSRGLKENTTTQILATPLTHHKAIHISIPLSSFACHNRSSYWKLNSSILIYEDVKVEVKRLIQKYWTEAHC